MKNRILYLGLVCLLLSPFTYPYDQAFMDQVANANINTFETIEREPQEAKKPIWEKGVWERLLTLINPRVFEYNELSKREKREIAFKQAPAKPLADPAMIDTSFVHKMELVQGDARAGDHLSHRLTFHNGVDLVETEFGKKRCIEMITQPTSNVATLQQRQAIIKELASNDALRQKYTAILSKMQTAEELLFNLYQLDQVQESDKVLYFSSFFDQMGFNKSGEALTLATRLGQLQCAVSNAAVTAYCWYLPQFMARRMPPARAAQFQFIMRPLLGTLMIPTYIILMSSQKQLANLTKNMQQKMIAAASYINGARQLIELAQSQDVIAQNLPEMKIVTQQLRGTQKQSSEFNELNRLLQQSTFKPGEPSFFSSPGDTLLAYKQMVDTSIRSEFTQIMNVVGELDLYVALAQKVKAHEAMPVHYSFVRFKKDATPFISAQKFWNPFVDPQKVVTNSVQFDAQNMRNMILTGPNTGGKSTMLKGVMINLLLAQTFGIAAADELTLTPFTKLSCHMNITDDTAGGVSLFKAEVKRAQELMDMVRGLRPNQFAFIIIDEIFTGTAPEKAEELSYKFMEQLQGYPNIMFISATHFNKLTELEQVTDQQCKNYHTGAHVDADGKITAYTYTLEPGISPVNNAAQIAQEEGIFFKDKK